MAGRVPCLRVSVWVKCLRGDGLGVLKWFSVFYLEQQPPFVFYSCILGEGCYSGSLQMIGLQLFYAED